MSTEDHAGTMPSIETAAPSIETAARKKRYEKSRFLRTLRGAPVDRIPLWVMRQAGRYLPEYRKVRAKVDFATLCQTPDLATEVTLQPIARFGFDASIIFADIMTPLPAMGIDVDFAPGPVVADPIAKASDLDRMRLPTMEELAGPVAQSIRQTRSALPADVPLIGFAGAPLTLAAYLVEGGSSKDFSKLRKFMYAEPDAAQALFELLGKAMGLYLRAQVLAGADAVQLFDSWAGILDRATYLRFAAPAAKAAFAALADLDVPKIYFGNSGAALGDAVLTVEADAYGVDWRTSLPVARARLGATRPLQGNLDPAWLFAPASALKVEVERVLHEGLGGPHVFNLGHGILPATPVENVAVLRDVVQQFDLQANAAKHAHG